MSFYVQYGASYAYAAAFSVSSQLCKDSAIVAAYFSTEHQGEKDGHGGGKSINR